MTESTIALLVMAAAVILPLLPAFLLFKFLSSGGNAEGTLFGIKLSLSGAVAAYFVVFLVIWNGRPMDDAHYHTWKVVGSIDTKPSQSEAEPNLNDVVVRIVPPRLDIMNQGAFEWEIPVVEDAAGRLHFPMLQLDLVGYRGLTLPLEPNRQYGAVTAVITHDYEGRVMHFASPIVLQSRRLSPAYVPTQAQAAVEDPTDRNTAAAATAAEGVK